MTIPNNENNNNNTVQMIKIMTLATIENTHKLNNGNKKRFNGKIYDIVTIKTKHK